LPRTHLALLVFAVAAFGLLAVTYDHEPVATVDHEIAEWIAESLPAWAETLARPLSWIGGWIGLTVLGLVTTALLLRERAWLDLAFFGVAFLGSQLVVMLLKEGFDRPRPELGSAVPLPSSSAFPSGHATAGVASLGALTVLAAERLPSRRARAWLWSLAIVMGLAIGLSRIALGVHYASDVLAGWCLGIAWLAGCLLVRDRLRTQAA
jgi:undecaprenyl-diphosphatase